MPRAMLSGRQHRHKGQEDRSAAHASHCGAGARVGAAGAAPAARVGGRPDGLQLGCQLGHLAGLSTCRRRRNGQPGEHRLLWLQGAINPTKHDATASRLGSLEAIKVRARQQGPAAHLPGPPLRLRCSGTAPPVPSAPAEQPRCCPPHAPQNPACQGAKKGVAGAVVVGGMLRPAVTADTPRPTHRPLPTATNSSRSSNLPSLSTEQQAAGQEQQTGTTLPQAATGKPTAPAVGLQNSSLSCLGGRPAGHSALTPWWTS